MTFTSFIMTSWYVIGRISEVEIYIGVCPSGRSRKRGRVSLTRREVVKRRI
jgi:hypothetical protein